MKVVPITIAAILLAGGAIVAGILMTEPAKVADKKPHWASRTSSISPPRPGLWMPCLHWPA
jgi:hypothetical protein